MEDSLTKNDIFYNFMNTLSLKNENKIKKLCKIYNSYINDIYIEKISFNEFKESRKKGNKILDMNSK